MRNLSKLALALAFAVPAAASAQAPVLGSIKFGGDISSNGSIGGAAVGPYQADLKGYSPLIADINKAIIWCVDWGHVAPSKSVFDTYYGTAFIGTDFSKTRGVTDLLLTSAAAKAKYSQAAWLIEQYDLNVVGYSAVNVQGTIWKLFNSGAPTSGYTNKLASVPGTVSLTRDWFVLSDKFTSGSYSNQEFLYSRARMTPTNSVVPEPSTYALMATGLLALGYLSRRRRQ